MTAAEEFYQAAVELKEALEPLVLRGEIDDEDVERAYYRLDAATDEYGGPTNGNHNQAQ